jgi:hypothetical protein
VRDEPPVTIAPEVGSSVARPPPAVEPPEPTMPPRERGAGFVFGFAGVVLTFAGVDVLAGVVTVLVVVELDVAVRVLVDVTEDETKVGAGVVLAGVDGVDGVFERFGVASERTNSDLPTTFSTCVGAATGTLLESGPSGVTRAGNARSSCSERSSGIRAR